MVVEGLLWQLLVLAVVLLNVVSSITGVIVLWGLAVAFQDFQVALLYL